MANTIVPKDSNGDVPAHVARVADLLGGLANIADSIDEAGGVASQFPFIGINNDGQWHFGQNRTLVEEGSEWAVDIRTWSHGYIAWPDPKAKERKPLGERMVPANKPLPALASLPEVDGEWKVQFAFEMLCMSGEDAGKLAIYKNGSYGAKALVQSLIGDVRKQATVDPSRLCPVVVLEISTYWHNDWKKDVHNPVFRIVKWVGFEDYDGFDKVTGPDGDGGQELETAPEPAPAPRATRARAAAAQPAPAGRRRPAARAQPAE